MLSVYGAYGSTATRPSFNRMALPLLDAGIVLASAHVRGGGELGAAWANAGRRFKKRNTVLDLLACARALVSSGITSHTQFAVWGRSAGEI